MSRHTGNGSRLLLESVNWRRAKVGANREDNRGTVVSWPDRTRLSIRFDTIRYDLIQFARASFDIPEVEESRSLDTWVEGGFEFR